VVRSPLYDVQLEFVDSIDKAYELKRWLGERREGPIGLDTETSGFSAWHDELRLVQFGDLHRGWAVPYPKWQGVVQEILRDWEGEWVLHNGPFDTKFLKVQAGWDPPWERMHDTMTLAGLDDSSRLRGLKYLGGKLIDATATAGEKLLHDGMAAQKWTWGTVPYDFQPYVIYGALDTVLTAHLFHYLHPRVMATCPDAYDLERGTIRVVTNMMMTGLLIDQDYVRKALTELQNFSTASRAWLKTNHKVTSPMSAKQIAAALEAHGYVVTEFTPTNLPKVDKETLNFIRQSGNTPEIRELARQVLAVRHADKLSGTYLTAFLEGVDANGRLHGTISPMGARTHRMTASEPNLQNLPRGDKVVRGSIIPNQGNVLITCDLSQVEARLGSHFTEDPGLIEAFRAADEDGADFFCGVASGIFGERIDKADPRRQTTKNVVYGAFYGAGAAKMAWTAGVPFETMAPVKAAFDERFPGIKTRTRWLIDQALAMEQPAVRLPDGRYLRCDRDRLATQGLNSEIQGHAAALMKRLLLNIEAAGFGPNLLNVVHDEAVLEVAAADAEEALRIVEDCMTDRDSYRVAITAEGKIMRERWAK
jgi:DNA polymerase I-like protein with 3'-5' exonuclease and polymerase domains